MTLPALPSGFRPAITRRRAASSVAPVLLARGLPASLPGLVLATRKLGNNTGRVT